MRGTGKTTLINSLYKSKEVLVINLLRPEEEFKYRAHPELLRQELVAMHDNGTLPGTVVIDEVQKIPALLDIVHELIEEKKIKFILTGSSARKLKRGGANLLAGRAFVHSLFPLSFLEVKKDFSLENFLRWGGLPFIYGPNAKIELEKKRFLMAYVNTYLKEEIQIEQIVRKIEPFHYFMEIAAQMNGEIINYSSLASEANTDDKTVSRYYTILEDTLLGFLLPAYHRSFRKRQLMGSKFYFIDSGIINALQNRLNEKITPSNYAFGKLFESMVISEIFKLNSYYEKNYRLSYLKTKDGVEIDLVVEASAKKIFFVEIKSGAVNDLSSFHTKVKLLRDNRIQSKLIVLSQNVKGLANQDVEVFPWQDGIKKIFLTTLHRDIS